MSVLCISTRIPGIYLCIVNINQTKIYFTMEDTPLNAGQPMPTDTLPDTDAETVTAEDAVDEINEDNAVTQTKQEPESETTQNAEMAHDAELERLIAEAEERGYRRGRNESISRLMEHPARVDPELNNMPVASEPEILILANIRPSIWD